jgi:hypothetical protein
LISRAVSFTKLAKALEDLGIGSVKGIASEFVLTFGVAGSETHVDGTTSLVEAIKDLYKKSNEVRLLLGLDRRMMRRYVQ